MHGNREFFDFATAVRRQPEKAQALQAELNKKRRTRVEKALSTRPVYLPLYFHLPAEGQPSPVSDATTPESYDIIITHIATNTDRELILRRAENDEPFVRVGDQTNLRLTASEIASQRESTEDGQRSVFLLPQPFLLDAGRRLSVDLVKTEATADAESAVIVFCGYRVYRSADAQAGLSAIQSKLVDFFISARSMPEVRWLKQEIAFGSTAVGARFESEFAPAVDEPLLIRGVRTSLHFAKFDVAIQGEASWTTAETPLWAIANSADNEQETYLYFERPIFLPAKSRLVLRGANSYDGVNHDPARGTLTWICETV